MIFTIKAMDKVQKRLLRSISQGKPLSDRFMLVIMDSSLPNNIKKKSILYYKGDKRLSREKFVKDLRVSNVMRGGVLGWKFVAVGNAAYKVGEQGSPTGPLVYSPSPSPPQQASPTGPFLFGNYASPSPSPSPSHTPVTSSTSQVLKYNNGEQTLILTKQLGSGSFAAVFDIAFDHTPSYVCKWFFATSDKVLEGIISNIESFAKSQDKGNKGITGIFGDSFVYYEFIDTIIYKEQKFSKFGYKMVKCPESLNDILKKTLEDAQEDAVQAAVEAVKRQLEQKIFVHGDIKLDNIMMQGAIPLISDWDGVYVYIKDDNFTQPPENVCFSPATTHPYYVWYIAMCKAAKGETDISEIFKDSKLNPDALWNYHLGAGTAADEVRRMFYGMYGLQDAYYTYVKKNETDIEWHKHMLQRCDMYSLGMSLYLCLLHKGIDNDDLKALAETIIREGCKMYSQEGGKEKDNQGDKQFFLVENIKKPQSVAANTVNLRDNSELAELMQSRMFISNEQVDSSIEWKKEKYF